MTAFSGAFACLKVVLLLLVVPGRQYLEKFVLCGVEVHVLSHVLHAVLITSHRHKIVFINACVGQALGGFGNLVIPTLEG